MLNKIKAAGQNFQSFIAYLSWDKENLPSEAVQHNERTADNQYFLSFALAHYIELALDPSRLVISHQKR